MPRDSVTGAEILAINDGHHIEIVDDGVPVIYLTPTAAVLLARQLLEAVTPGGAQ